MNIMIISAFFPPDVAVGGKRFAFLTRYLSRKGIQADVIAMRGADNHANDQALVSDCVVHRVRARPIYPVSESMPVRRLVNWVWTRSICTLDPFSGWIVPAVRYALFKGKCQSASAIIATAPPFSAMVVGYLLSRACELPLILDYRDPWTNHPRVYPCPLGGVANRCLERAIVRHAKATVHVTASMQRNFMRAFHDCLHRQCHCITNGFEPQEQLAPLALEPRRFSLVYAGNLYGMRSIRLVLEPLLQLMARGELSRDAVGVHVFGDLPNEDKRFIVETQADDIVSTHPFTPYESLLSYLKGADALYLPSGSDVGYAVPFKFYDYLSVRRPIMAVVPRDSEIYRMLKAVDCGETAIIDDPQSIANALRTIIGDTRPYAFADVERYRWSMLADQYAEVISSVARR